MTDYAKFFQYKFVIFIEIYFMKHTNSIIVVILIAFIISIISCVQSENKVFLVGKWQGTQWLVDGNPSEYDAKQVNFTFDKVGGYTANFGNSNEKGTYILTEDKLYTTPEGQLEIMVEIAKLTKDSLVFNMNRSGRPEQLTLLKVSN